MPVGWLDAVDRLVAYKHEQTAHQDQHVLQAERVSTPEPPPAQEDESEEESSDGYDYSNAKEDGLGEESSSSLVIDCLANTNMERAAARIFDVAMSQVEDFTLMVGRGEEDVRMEGDGAVVLSST